jgi:alpha-mannosidase
MKKITLHLIANSHLDPVWLWDWREGLNEAITTVRTVLKLMEERPELTYIRGESAIYEQIEKHDPESFQKIKRLVRAGRWDVVGGAYLQPDMNLPATETLVRHFVYGQNYFRKHFGKTVKVGWSADCFGHSAGLPEILRTAGISYYVFGRPFFDQREKLFWWESASGARVLATTYLQGWYGCERGEISSRLDAFVKAAPTMRVKNILVPFGLGNHGGGPTRRHLDDILVWADAHPEVEVKFSGFHAYFAAVEKELRAGKIQLPVVRDELNFCLRGCYSSAARVKFLYRQTEAAVSRAETTATAVSALLRQSPPDCATLWKSVLFNSFHDILPGTSIERALAEQVEWLGGARHQAREMERDALLALARAVDTTVPKPAQDMPSAVSFLVWNPHPQTYRGPLELEAPMDYRPIFAYDKRGDALPLELRDARGRLLPFQTVQPEHLFMTHLPWRKRIVFDAEIPALGWSVFNFGWVEKAKSPALPASKATAKGNNSIQNSRYRILAGVGQSGLRIVRDGKNLFGSQGLSLVTVEDPFGPWGGHYEEPESHDLSKVLHRWAIVETSVLERGPLRSSLWVRLEGGDSRCEFTVQLHHNRDAVNFQVRLFFDEKKARVKLVFPLGAKAEFEVPGGKITRGPSGEVPGGRWVRVLDKSGRAVLGFASDALYNFDQKPGQFRATIVRSGRHTLDVPDTAQSVPVNATVIDSGEYQLRFVLNSGDKSLETMAESLALPPVALPVPPSDGKLPRSGSVLTLPQNNLRLLALKGEESGKGMILRVMETDVISRPVDATWLGRRLKLGGIKKGTIESIRLPGEKKALSI